MVDITYPLDCSYMTCRGCGGHHIMGRLVDSSDEAYTDLNYKCMDCGKEGWIDGPDA